MWHPLRGVLEPFSEHRLLLARDPRLALSPARPKRLFGSVGGRLAPARWRGSGRLQKRSVDHASHRRGPTSDSAILSELARCYCLHTARAQAACRGVDRQLTKPLACTAQWRKSANQMVKRPSPGRRATARLRRFGPFAGPRSSGKVRLTRAGPSRAIPGLRQQIVSRPPSGHSGRLRHAVGQVVRRLRCAGSCEAIEALGGLSSPRSSVSRYSSSTSCCAACLTCSKYASLLG